VMGICVLKYWRGYDLRLHPHMDEDGFRWEPELSRIDDWLEEHNDMPPIDFIEIHPRRVLLVMKGLNGTILLYKTPEGFQLEEP